MNLGIHSGRRQLTPESYLFAFTRVHIHSVQCFRFHLSHTIIKFNYKKKHFSLFMKYNHWKKCLSWYSQRLWRKWTGTRTCEHQLRTHTVTGITLEFGQWELSLDFGLDPSNVFFFMVGSSESMIHLDVFSHLRILTGGHCETGLDQDFPSRRVYIPKKWYHPKTG